MTDLTKIIADWRPSPCPVCGTMREAQRNLVCQNAECPLCGVVVRTATQDRHPPITVDPYTEALRQNRSLREENARLREALALCRDEIDGYIRQEYPSDHPAEKRRRERDFSSNPARAALAEGGDT